MTITPISTRPMVPPQDNLFSVFKECGIKPIERSIVAVTSKVVAIHQGRCIPMTEVERDDLVPLEADWYLPREAVQGGLVMFSIKENTLVASAGIDKSNAGEYMVLWPEQLEEAAREIQEYLRETFSLDEVGVILTDSHTIPFRRGLMGQALSYFGFDPLASYISKEDIFGRALTVSVKNIPDSLAAAAVVVMGEGAEQTPMALITELDFVRFSNDLAINSGEMTLKVPLEEDIYNTFFTSAEWIRGKGGIDRDALEAMKRRQK